MLETALAPPCPKSQVPSKSNYNNLVYELGIHLVLAKQEKLTSNRLAKQLGINGKLPSLPVPGANIRAVTFCHRDLHLVFWLRRHTSRARKGLARASRSPAARACLLFSRTRQVSLSSCFCFSPRKWLSQIDQSPGSATVARGTHRQEEDRHGRQGDAHLLIARPGMIPNCCSGC